MDLQANTSSISHLSLLLTWIGNRGGLIYPSKGSVTAFYSLFSKKTKWTLIKSGSSILYKLPTLLKILYSPTI